MSKEKNALADQMRKNVELAHDQMKHTIETTASQMKQNIEMSTNFMNLMVGSINSPEVERTKNEMFCKRL